MKTIEKKQLEEAKKLDPTEIRENLKMRKIKGGTIAKRLNRSNGTISKALQGIRPATLLRIYKAYIKEQKF